MRPRTEDEINEDTNRILSALKQRQNELRRDDGDIYQKVERIEKVGRAIYFFGAIFVAVVLWIGYVQVSIRQIQTELESRKETVQRVNEMWWMKEHGVSNRSDFFDKHGIQAPPREEGEKK